MLLFCPLLLIAQSKNDSLKLSKLEESLEKQVKDLNSKVDSLQKTSDSIAKYKRAQEEIIKKSEKSLTNQGSVITWFGVIFTILTILLALATFVIPFISYKYGIKRVRTALIALHDRSQENNNKITNALNELDVTLESKVDRYLENKRQKEIDKYALDLNGEDGNTKEYALNFFNNNWHLNFTEDQLYQLYMYVISSEADNRLEPRVFLTKENKYADLIIHKQLNNLRYPKLNYHLKYIADFGKERFKGVLRRFIFRKGENLESVVYQMVTIQEFGLYNQIRIDNQEAINIIKNTLKTNLLNLNTHGNFFLFVGTYTNLDRLIILNSWDIVNSISQENIDDYIKDPQNVADLLLVTKISPEELNKTPFGQRIEQARQRMASESEGKDEST